MVHGAWSILLANGVLAIFGNSLSALVSGMLLLVLNSYRAYRRDARERLEKHAREIRDLREAIRRIEQACDPPLEPFQFTT